MRVENKDIFIDLERNKSGVYVKISEKNGSLRNAVLIPISGISGLKKVLDEVTLASETMKVARFVHFLLEFLQLLTSLFLPNLLQYLLSATTLLIS